MAVRRKALVEGIDKVVMKDLDKKLTAVRKEILAKLKKLIGKDTLELMENDILISDTNTSDIFTTINSESASTDEADDVYIEDMSTDLLLLLLQNISDNIAQLKP